MANWKLEDGGDVIDSCDILERISELEAIELDDMAEEDRDELTELRDVADLCEGIGGASFISESYWVEYIKELCEDIGALPIGIPHYIEIDWDATARNISTDYTVVEIGGRDYYVSSR